MTHKGIIKLNLGCGPSGIKGWINYDWGILPFISKYPYLRQLLIRIKILSKNYAVSWPVVKLVDIRKRFPLESESVNYIYCSQVLEHFEKYTALDILKECYRVLKKNGVIRIVLPNLKKMVGKYKNADEFTRDFFGYEKDKKGFTNIFIRGHQWMYDELSFRKLLMVVFEKIEKRKFREGLVPDLNKLDLELHRDHSFYIEAIK
jgi:SAM-dependent methyltransferase